MFSLVSYLVPLLLFCGPPDTAKHQAGKTRIASDDDARKAATAFVNHLTAGRYKDAAQLNDATMAKAMPAKKLKDAWLQLTEANGAFKSLGEPTTFRQAGYLVCAFPATFEHAGLRIQVSVDAAGHIAGLYFRPAADKAVGQLPSYLKTRVKDRDVTVGEGQWALPGTLTLPEMAAPKAAVVFVHGSGPNDRDETIGPNKPFRDLALGLASHGIASLRYDKRSRVHGKEMIGKSLTVKEEVIDDALTALKLLRDQSETKDVPIFLLGHSLGAVLAPEIATADAHLSGVILLAAAARPFPDIIVDQYTYLCSLSPGKESAAELAKITRQARALRERTLAADEKVINADRTYWYDLCDRDSKTMLKTAAALTCPILVLQGGRDYQATKEDLDLFKKALAEHPRAKCKLFADLNHLFAAGEGKATPMEYNDEKHVAPKVINLIADWCLKP